MVRPDDRRARRCTRSPAGPCVPHRAVDDLADAPAGARACRSLEPEQVVFADRHGDGPLHVNTISYHYRIPKPSQINSPGMALGSIEQRFTAALASFIEQVKEDRSILAAVLCGSLSHDTVWAKSHVHHRLGTPAHRKIEP